MPAYWDQGTMKSGSTTEAHAKVVQNLESAGSPIRLESWLGARPCHLGACCLHGPPLVAGCPPHPGFAPPSNLACGPPHQPPGHSTCQPLSTAPKLTASRAQWPGRDSFCLPGSTCTSVRSSVESRKPGATAGFKGNCGQLSVELRSHYCYDRGWQLAIHP